MNVYDAIMKAADQIELHPSLFLFSQWRVPTDCGLPGCALGWIGFFSGRKQKMHDEVSTQVLRLGSRAESDFIFYGRMDDICGTRDWRVSARDCAKGLRLYAAKYHAPKRTDSELVADLMTRVSGEPIPEDA